MLLHPRTLDLAPSIERVLAALAGDGRFKAELVAAQIETLTPPPATAASAAAVLRDARRDLAAALDGRALVAGAGVHPFAAALGELHGAPRYASSRRSSPASHAASSSSACTSMSSCAAPARAVAIHDALRSYLPELAALAANAPFYEGHDSGLASVRPTIAAMLPRQGVPPSLEAGRHSSARWTGARRRRAAQEGRWWWELRLHRSSARSRSASPTRRRPSARPPHRRRRARARDVAGRARRGRRDAAGGAVVAHRREPLVGGAPRPRRDLRGPRHRRARAGARAAGALLDELAPVAARLGCAAELERARALVAGPGGAARQRAVATREGSTGLWPARRAAARRRCARRRRPVAVRRGRQGVDGAAC